jgi:hypothetical protein
MTNKRAAKNKPSQMVLHKKREAVQTALSNVKRSIKSLKQHKGHMRKRFKNCS